MWTLVLANARQSDGASQMRAFLRSTSGACHELRAGPSKRSSHSPSVSTERSNTVVSPPTRPAAARSMKSARLTACTSPPPEPTGGSR